MKEDLLENFCDLRKEIKDTQLMKEEFAKVRPANPIHATAFNIFGGFSLLTTISLAAKRETNGAEDGNPDAP